MKAVQHSITSTNPTCRWLHADISICMLANLYVNNASWSVLRSLDVFLVLHTPCKACERCFVLRRMTQRCTVRQHQLELFTRFMPFTVTPGFLSSLCTLLMTPVCPASLPLVITTVSPLRIFHLFLENMDCSARLCRPMMSTPRQYQMQRCFCNRSERVLCCQGEGLQLIESLLLRTRDLY